jgi:hypothetical protein
VIEVKTLIELISLLLTTCAIAFTGFRWMSARLDATLLMWRDELQKQHHELHDKHDLLRRDMEQLQRDLPLQYYRREEQIRQDALINTKLDALASRLERYNEATKQRIICYGQDKETA